MRASLFSRKARKDRTQSTQRFISWKTSNYWNFEFQIASALSACNSLCELCVKGAQLDFNEESIQDFQNSMNFKRKINQISKILKLN